jgi:hypothetical protein
MLFRGMPSFFMMVPPKLNYGHPRHILMCFWNILIKSIKVSEDVPGDLPYGGLAVNGLTE